MEQVIITAYTFDTLDNVINSIAKKIGVTGAYSYNTIVLGKEVALHIVPK